MVTNLVLNEDCFVMVKRIVLMVQMKILVVRINNSIHIFIRVKKVTKLFGFTNYLAVI